MPHISKRYLQNRGGMWTFFDLRDDRIENARIIHEIIEKKT